MGIFDLSGRVAVVTGGNGGIGLGIAQALAAEGCAVSIWGRNAEKNARAVASITGKGGKAEARICDVTDATSVKAAMQATLDDSAASTVALPMPGSAAADVRPSSTAPKRTGARCSPQISMACFMSSRRLRGT